MKTKGGLPINGFWGMIVYEIKGDGCLNGLWTNNHIQTDWTVRNEIARKKKNYVGQEQRDELTGLYTVVWIEDPENSGKSTSGKLTITFDKPTKVYSLLWDKTFKGRGFLIDGRLVVMYWNYDEILCLSDSINTKKSEE